MINLNWFPPLLALAAVCLASFVAAAQDPYSDKVARIAAKEQSYDGEMVDNLVSLGSDAVPAIAAALLAKPRFPIVYVMALARMGDRRGTLPVLEFLSTLDTHTEADGSFLVVMIINQLAQFNDPRAEQPLSDLMRDTSNHPRVRLAAAATLAGLKQPPTSAVAAEHVMAMYRDRHRYYGRMGAGFEAHDLHHAMIKVDTVESLAALMAELDGGVPPYIAMPIIQYLGTRNHPDIPDLMLTIADNPSSHDPHVRLAAITAIATSTPDFPRAGLIDRLTLLARIEAAGNSDDYSATVAQDARNLICSMIQCSKPLPMSATDK